MRGYRIRRLGIVRLSAIGDVVLAMPLAMGLRRALPRARIVWIVQAAAAPLLRGHPAVDEAVIFPRRGGLRGWWRFVSGLRARRLDATVDPQGNLKSGLVGLLSGARLRTGLHVRDCKEWGNALLTNRRGRRARGPHGVERSWAAADPLGIEPGPDAWGLRATEGERGAWRARCRAAGADPEGPLLAMHLTDPENARSWFADAWARTARAMAAAGFQVVLNGTADVSGLAREILSEGVHDLTGTDDLRGLLAQFESMAERPGNLLLSPDSGPAHLATATGLRVLCMAGPQDPLRTGPRHGAFVHAWDGLDCAPCIERKCVRKPPDRACMRNLAAETVVERLLRLRDEGVELEARG